MYQVAVLSLGFTCTGSEEFPDAVCFLCDKMLANSSLVPTKLRRHLEKNHPTYKDKYISFFESKLKSHNDSKKFMLKKFQTENENATEVSYKVSYRIALNGETHIIGESLIKPCVKDIVSSILGKEYVKEVEAISISNNTVSRRINDIADDIKNELISRLHICEAFVLQLDESTDVAGLAILLVFIRYDFEKIIEEDLLICESVKMNTTGENIFNCINNFMTIHKISWKKRIEVCSDGAKAMTGKVGGAVVQIQNVALNSKSNHCLLHRYALVTKRISVSLKSALDEAVKIVNFIKSRPLQSRIFTTLCEDMGSIHTTLLLHTEVRWLSRGKVFVRLFELRKELLAYFMDHKHELSNRLKNRSWLCILAYFADIFGKLNDTCLSLQGKELNIFQAKQKLVALSKKIEYWISAMGQKNFECFPTLSEFLKECETDLDIEIYENIKTHLENLLISLNEYFPNLSNTDNYWVENPFRIQNKPEELLATEYENFIDMVSDKELEAKFETVPLINFWSHVFAEYPNLGKKAIKILLPFPTTYLCEVGFSKYTATKTKYRNRLDATSDMRIQLSNITPDIKRIMKSKKRYHYSH